MNKKQLIVVWMMVILLSGCSTAPKTTDTPSLEQRLEDLKKRVDYNREKTQEFLDSLKQGMPEEEVFGLLVPLMDRGIAYIRHATEEASGSEKIEQIQISFTFEKDILLSFKDNILDSWALGD